MPMCKSIGVFHKGCSLHRGEEGSAKSGHLRMVGEGGSRGQRQMQTLPQNNFKWHFMNNSGNFLAR